MAGTVEEICVFTFIQKQGHNIKPSHFSFFLPRIFMLLAYIVKGNKGC